MILYQLTAPSVNNTDSSGDIDSIIDGIYLAQNSSGTRANTDNNY